MKLQFQLQYHTQLGETMFVVGNHPALGNNNENKALPMHYLNNELCVAELIIPDWNTIEEKIHYSYVLQKADGTFVHDFSKSRCINPIDHTEALLLIIDVWNSANVFENIFYTKFFKCLRPIVNFENTLVLEKITHILKVKYPMLPEGESLCLLGEGEALHDWNTSSPILLHPNKEDDFYNVGVDLSNTHFPVAYKYGIYDTVTKKFIRFEQGNNRVIDDFVQEHKKTIVQDEWMESPNKMWRGAGVAIPVFSLRSNNGFGIGEFTDIQLLADWCAATGLKVIQLLPINDTTATRTDKDSYPYAAISAFALHPIYLNVSNIATTEESEKIIATYNDTKARLNAASTVLYTEVLKYKWELIHQLYPLEKDVVFVEEDYKTFFLANKHWLQPYASFCSLRDTYKTADHTQWEVSKQQLNETLLDDDESILVHYFVQYHLHKQITTAVEYAHTKGVAIKGDIPIGVHPHSVETWQYPQYFNTNYYAGAPPDLFSEKGQNWQIPTYNWRAIRKDNMAWWTKRLQQMELYFDAYRIDHILGFFRIWQIPTHAVEGVMGRLSPAIPIDIYELRQHNIYFNAPRYLQPFINDQVLTEIFVEEDICTIVRDTFLNATTANCYKLKEDFATQRQVEKYFSTKNICRENTALQEGLYKLIANVILFEEEGTQQQQFHFRFGMHHTSSFKNLESDTKAQLYTLYENYFYHRQESFWKQGALQKLLPIKYATNMLVCGEDLGFLCNAVNEVMDELYFLHLDVQRMPRKMGDRFSKPETARYLTVVTPSTHDTTTIRSWWEENPDDTQFFFNKILNRQGKAPATCEPWLNEIIVMAHLFSPAMLSIFQLQDLLGRDKLLRRKNTKKERINDPANNNHIWNYRLHLCLEELVSATAFNRELKKMITIADR